MRRLLASALFLLMGGAQNVGAAHKPFPYGVYESAGGIRQAFDNVVARTPLIPGQEGVLVRAGWNVCGDDYACLITTLRINLDSAQELGLKVALAIGDGDLAPAGVKSRCTSFDFEFRGAPATLCLPWDENYLADKRNFLASLGEALDSHPALAHVYFTGACATNGFEGHCRIDESAFTAAGYTPERFNNAYIAIMQAYLDSFSTTPITFEAHAIFNRIDMWATLWEQFAASGRVGIAAWWCGERLSLRGDETVLVWPLVQEIAAASYAVCQTVGNFSAQPYRFTDLQLSIPLDYGSETDWLPQDEERAFSETLEWISGSASHAGQEPPSISFKALEAWTQDINDVRFQERLANALDNDVIFQSSFESPSATNPAPTQ